MLRKTRSAKMGVPNFLFVTFVNVTRLIVRMIRTKEEKWDRGLMKSIKKMPE